MKYDAIVLGGSYAGLSAAMYIARGRRSVAVIDAGQPRNRFAHATHGFFGQEGVRPADAIRKARADLQRYPEVAFLHANATAAHAEDTGEFAVTLDSGEELRAAKLVLAFGIIDLLPDVPGLQERWGKSVLHCPYCHGYEFNDRPLGVLATGAMATHQALMISNWGPTTLFLNGREEPDPATLETLRSSNVRIERTPVAALEGKGDSLGGVRLVDGRVENLDALYIAPDTKLASPVAEQLGCALEAKPTGPILRVDAAMLTSVPGVYACGDIARWPGNASLATADGVAAGMSLSRELILAR